MRPGVPAGLRRQLTFTPANRRGPSTPSAATLPLGSVGYEAEATTKGERLIWLEPRWVDNLAAMRGPGKTYSDVIIRLAADWRAK